MLFNSLHFFGFLAVLLPLYFSVGEKNQRRILFLFSLYFYSCLKLVFVPILFLSFTATYVSAIQIQNSQTTRAKKLWLFHTLTVNLGILFLFKYLDFFRSIEYDVRALLGLPYSQFEPVGLILPLGISFYTFQAIAYVVDVYRGIIPAEKKFFNFALFLLFFPQLVAGPIMRANVLIPQFEGQKRFSLENFQIGFPILVLGFFKKTLLADPIAEIIKPIFSNPSQFDALSCLLGGVLFSLQIYGDFSGYSDIAIGIGKILGFDITKNFERPFLSSSVTETWRRWHISLSSWLRDYIYISLGGNRRGRLRNYFNLNMTMILGAFWHGANWTFLAWGAVGSLFMSLERYASEKGWNDFFINVPRPLKVLYAFFVFVIGSIFFRAENISKALIQINKIFTLGNGQFYVELFSSSVIVPICGLAFYEILEELNLWKKFTLIPIVQFLKPVFYAVVFILCIVIYTVTSSPQFYYFQF